VSDAARPVADNAGADSTTIATSPSPVTAPGPSMVDGKVPCVS
jgi:hypothetical protein